MKLKQPESLRRISVLCKTKRNGLDASYSIWTQFVLVEGTESGGAGLSALAKPVSLM